MACACQIRPPEMDWNNYLVLQLCRSLVTSWCRRSSGLRDSVGSGSATLGMELFSGKRGPTGSLGRRDSLGVFLFLFFLWGHLSAAGAHCPAWTLERKPSFLGDGEDSSQCLKDRDYRVRTQERTRQYLWVGALWYCKVSLWRRPMIQENWVQSPEGDQTSLGPLCGN